MTSGKQMNDGTYASVIVMHKSKAVDSPSQWLRPVTFFMQLCSEDIWRGIMAQIDTLGIAPQDLPEEALTQIYQVRPSLGKSLHDCHAHPQKHFFVVQCFQAIKS